jgi:hypothetical protein
MRERRTTPVLKSPYSEAYAPRGHQRQEVAAFGVVFCSGQRECHCSGCVDSRALSCCRSLRKTFSPLRMRTRAPSRSPILGWHGTLTLNLVRSARQVRRRVGSHLSGYRVTDRGTVRILQCLDHDHLVLCPETWTIRGLESEHIDLTARSQSAGLFLIHFVENFQHYLAGVSLCVRVRGTGFGGQGSGDTILNATWFGFRSSGDTILNIRVRGTPYLMSRGLGSGEG